MASVNEPLLPYKYDNEKSSRSSLDSFEESSTPLRLGGGDSTLSRVKERVHGLSKTRKVIALGVIAVLGFHIAGKGLKGLHHRHHACGHAWEEEVDEVSLDSHVAHSAVVDDCLFEQITVIPAEYGSTYNIPSSSFITGNDLFTANASFPIDLTKEISLDLLSSGRVLISRSEFETETPEAQITVESVWSGEEGGQVQLVSGKWAETVVIAVRICTL